MSEQEKIRVIEATLDDLPRLMEMGKLFYESANLDRLSPWDPEVVESAVFKLAIEHPDRTALLAALPDKIVGMIVLAISPYAFGGGLAFAHELCWWVDPENRRTGVGKALLDAAEEWARDNGASHMDMIALGSSEPAKAATIYLGRGYRLLESHYLKEIA